MSDTPLRMASLREIAEELLRREQDVDAAEPSPVPPATVGDRPAGVRNGQDRRLARQQERG